MALAVSRSPALVAIDGPGSCAPEGHTSRADERRLSRSVCAIRWTRAGLATLGLAAVPKRINQDQRDAIAAAVTARQHTTGLTESFGEIVVPAARATRAPAPRGCHTPPT